MNLNEKTLFVSGRDPLAKNNRPPFASPEVTEAAVWMENGIKNEAASVDPAIDGTILPNGAITDLRYKSDLPCKNAVVLKDGTYVLSNPDIRLSGCGCSDFTSKGAGVLALQGARVDIRKGNIETNGATRAATIATQGAILKVFDSTLSTHGGPLPDDYVPVIGPGMMEPPAPLGLGGNCRTHLSMDNSESYFYNCNILADGWAALSTDASGGYVYLEANDSKINVGDGYCVYADNGCHVVLNHCLISSGNVLGIQDGNSSILFRNVDGTSTGYGFLIHGGMHDLRDIGYLEFKNSDLTSGGPMFRCKSTNVNIYLKNCTLTCKDGTILETIVTDDEFYYKTRCHDADEYGEQFSFESMDLYGDMLCNDCERKNCINLIDTTVTGAITGFPVLTMDEGSRWFATRDSQVSLSSLPDSIDASHGVNVQAVIPGMPSSSQELPSGGVLTVLPALPESD